MPVYEYQKNGKTAYYVKTNYQDENGHNKQHCKRGFKGIRAAQAYERDYLANASRQPLEAAESPVEPVRTFHAVYEEYWVATVKKGLREGTQETKQNMLQKHVLPYFADYEMDAITPDIIREWQAEIQRKERRGKPFTATYLHSIQSQLNAVLNYAVRKAYIKASPMADCKNMGAKNAEPRQVWSREEYARFKKYAQQQEDTFLIFELCYWLGLRRGEALSIRPMDVFYDARVGCKQIRIATTTDAKRRTGNTKTASSNRVVPLPEFLDAELNAYMRTIYNLQPNQRIFQHVTVSKLYRDIARAEEAAELPHICIHGMRHSAASNMLTTGLTSGTLAITDVSALLGHSSAKTTLRTYSHILPAARVAAADLIATLHDEY